MLREVHKFDEDGFLLLGESIVVDGECPEGYEDIEIPQGLFKPRMVDGEVVEGATQEEIDAITAAPPQEPTEIELLRAENQQLKETQNLMQLALDEIILSLGGM